MRAMIIDDSRAMRSMLRNFLNKLGIDVVAEAGNGREALEVFARSLPLDVALIDWNMPEMDGFSFLKIVRQNPAHAAVRMMMVTTEAEANKILDALDAGADEYLIKPFSRDGFREKLVLMGLLDA
ncbi:MAG: response regulator [Deltaproteobacteria bacterium]|nr:response regulator [Deltaproteobacteria bacterium]